MAGRLRSRSTAGARLCRPTRRRRACRSVELEWTQFDEEPGQIAVARRVWAPTISDALQSMVEDRRTDLTLEQIEQAAAEETNGATELPSGATARRLTHDKASPLTGVKVPCESPRLRARAAASMAHR